MNVDVVTESRCLGLRREAVIGMRGKPEGEWQGVIDARRRI